MGTRPMEGRRVRGLALAIVGVLLFVSPLVVLALLALASNLAMPGFTLAQFLIAWSILGVAGFVALIAGVATLGRSAIPAGDSRPPQRSPGLRLGTAAGVFMLVGFLVLFSLLAWAAGCESPCAGGGGNVGNQSSPGATTSCGSPCAANLANDPLWPLQLLVAGIGLNVIASALAVAAVARAWAGSAG